MLNWILSRSKQRKISESDSVKLAEGFDRFKNLKLEVVSAAGWTAEQIKSKAVQAQAEIIFVDYLTLMKSSGKTPYERATQIQWICIPWRSRWGLL